MSEESYNEGDLVEAEKKEIASSTRFRGVVSSQSFASGIRLTLNAQGYQPAMDWLEHEGFTITTIEKAKPPLPTEPGFYLSHQRRLWTLEFNGGWRDDYDVPCDFEVAGKFAPFTRLEPVAETAKRFRDRVLEEFKVSNFVSYESDVAVVAKEFGVTS